MTKPNPHLSDSRESKRNRKAKSQRYREYESSSLQSFWNAIISMHSIVLGIAAIIAALNPNRISTSMLLVFFILAISAITALLLVSARSCDLNNFRATYFEITSGMIDEVPDDYNSKDYDHRYKTRQHHHRKWVLTCSIIAFIFQITNCVFLFLVIQNKTPF